MRRNFCSWFGGASCWRLEMAPLLDAEKRTKNALWTPVTSVWAKIKGRDLRRWIRLETRYVMDPSRSKIGKSENFSEWTCDDVKSEGW